MLVVDCKFKIYLEVFQNALGSQWKRVISDQVYHIFFFGFSYFIYHGVTNRFLSDPKTDVCSSILAKRLRFLISCFMRHVTHG